MSFSLKLTVAVTLSRQAKSQKLLLPKTAEVPNHPIKYKQGIFWMNNFLSGQKDNSLSMVIELQAQKVKYSYNE